jgi:hypothetical protein
MHSKLFHSIHKWYNWQTSLQVIYSIIFILFQRAEILIFAVRFFTLLFNAFRAESLACSEAWLEKIGSEELSEATDINNKKKRCLQRCERQSETTSFTSSLYPIEATFSQHQFFCLTLQKVSKICNDSIKFKIIEATLNETGMSCSEILSSYNTKQLCTNKRQPNFAALQSNPKMSKFLYNYAKTNFAILRVFIKDPYYTLIKRDEQLTTISFLGNVGGLLSLCMGLSLVSIFEVIYHLSNFLMKKFE